MPTILNIETATTNCSVSIAKDGVLLAIKEHDTPNYSHSEQLHVFVQEVLEEAKLPITALDAIAVSKGPGSYTGLRIGVSAAKGLCYSLDVPLISISTLKSMATQIKSNKQSYIIPVLDARRMEVYSVVFNTAYEELRETRAEIIDEQSFAAYVKESETYIIGSGAQKCMTIVEDSNIIFNTGIVPSAREMCLLSYTKFQQNDFEDLAYFEPFYLKDFIVQTKAKKKA